MESPISSAVPWAASVFKIVSGAMLLSETSIDASRNYCVPPSRRSVELEDLTANSSRDSRCVDMTQAMAHSTNAYFARLVDQHISAELLGSWLERFAFNEIIPFELACEVSVAVVPSDRLERARMAAGFRHSRLSPLHGALLAGAVANRGLMMRPTIIQEIHDNTGNLLYRHEPEVWRQVMSERVAQRLADSLTLTATVGTARRYFRNREGWPRDLTVSGKTGTLSNRFDDEHEFDQNLIYTWFVGYSPSDEPNIAVSAVVYNTERWHIRGSFLASEAVIRYQRVRPQPSE